MQPDMIERLNAINREFYRITAHEFDQTRLVAWAGWHSLEAYLDTLPKPFRVLDVGCGNVRFGVFLAEKGDACHYHGTDNNSTLLALAQTALATHTTLTFELTERDSILNPLTEGGYDFVGLFGVLHHIPSATYRHQFMRQLAGQVANGGLLAFATWRFYEFERFQSRVVAWDDALAPLVEKNDYLLDWRRGERALRYCHYVDDAEQSELITATALTHLETYRADGFNNAVNSYSILKKA